MVAVKEKKTGGVRARLKLKRAKPRFDDIGEWIDYHCRTKRSTLAFFKRCGLTYDKNGEPVVVPR